MRNYKIAIGILILAMLLSLAPKAYDDYITKDITTDQYVTMVEESKVTSTTLYPKKAVFEIKAIDSDNTKYSVHVDQNAYFETIEPIEVSNSVNVKMGTVSEQLLTRIISVVLLYTIMFAAFTYYRRKKMGPGAGKSDFSKRYATDKSISFADIIGYEDEKKELLDLISFLENKKQFDKVGAKIPKGVLLEGPPGTGKTLLAKALSNEANIPFIYISASEFVEMYVGVGASRIRGLFLEAQKHPKAIIFIDEIDSIGSRAKSADGGQSEQEQTINQLLVEMDGFESKDKTIIVIAATNRSDILDEALLRPGRFDRKVMIGLPSLKDRIAILEFYVQKVKIVEDYDVEYIGRLTSGLCGADLAAVVNEAAIMAVRENLTQITQDNLIEAVSRVTNGPAKLSHRLSDIDKILISNYLAGQMFVSYAILDKFIIEKASIVGRINKPAYLTKNDPEKERFTRDKSAYLDEITILLAGRCANQIIDDTITLESEPDLAYASKIARAMVTQFSMQDFKIQLENQFYLNHMQVKTFSDTTNYEVDLLVESILADCAKKAEELVKSNLDVITVLAKALAEHEQLEQKQIIKIIKNQ